MINVLFGLELDIREPIPIHGDPTAGKERSVAEALARFTRQGDGTVRRLSFWR